MNTFWVTVRCNYATMSEIHWADSIMPSESITKMFNFTTAITKMKITILIKMWSWALCWILIVKRYASSTALLWIWAAHIKYRIHRSEIGMDRSHFVVAFSKAHRIVITLQHVGDYISISSRNVAESSPVWNLFLTVVYTRIKLSVTTSNDIISTLAMVLSVVYCQHRRPNKNWFWCRGY